MKHLEEELKGLKKPELSLKAKAEIRGNLLMHIQKHKHFEESITKVAHKTNPSAYLKTKIKESLLSAIELTRQPGIMLRNWQKLLASTLIFLISMTTFTTIYIADIPMTKAAAQTVLIEFSGNVDVIRDDVIIDVEDVMVLLQGDIVVTDKKSSAVIRYIDDSLSRLSPRSELKLTKLYQDENNKSQTEVEVELSKGRVWSQVVNLSGKKSTFRVGIKNISANVSEKASFDISVNEKEEPKVSVFENKVQVELEEEKRIKTQYVLEGYAIAAAEVNPEIEKISFNSVEDEVWIVVNQEKDKEYKKEIDKEKSEDAIDKAGMTPENPFYGAKKLNESTKLLFSGDDDKTKLKIDIAVKRFNEAKVYFDEGKVKEAEELLKEFNNAFIELAGEVRDSDELFDYLENRINEEEKDLSTVLPDSEKYKAKEALREVKKKVAQSEQEVKEAVYEETEEKINEVKELIKDEKDSLAQTTLEELKNTVMGTAYDDVESETDEVIEEQVESISSMGVLEEVIEKEGLISDEIVDLVEATKSVLEEDIEDSLIDPDVEVSFDSWEIANPIVDEESIEFIVEEKLHPIVSDSAVIISID